ncbi:hypothetical protein [Streptomyces kronopolitis]
MANERMDNVGVVVDDTLTGLRPHGAELLGEVAQYENTYRLCNLRGPSGIIVALAERIVVIRPQEG